MQKLSSIDGSRKKSFSTYVSTGYENTFYVFSYSFNVLEVFCQQFHWNIYANYFQNVYWRMIPAVDDDSTMQFIWNQDDKLVIIFKVLPENKIVKGIRNDLALSEENKMYYIELAGDELPKLYRDVLQKEGCRTSYFEVIYKRLMIDYQEVMKLELDSASEAGGNGDGGSQLGSNRKTSIGQRSIGQRSIEQRSQLGTKGGSKRQSLGGMSRIQTSNKPGSIGGASSLRRL